MLATVAWTVVTFLWQASILGALAWAAFAFSARLAPAPRYAISLVLFGCLVALPIVTAARVGRVTDGDLISAPNGELRSPAKRVQSDSVASPGTGLEIAAQPATNPEQSTWVGSSSRIFFSYWVAFQQQLFNGIVPIAGLIVFAWAIGVVTVGSRVIIDLRLIHRLRRAPLYSLPSGLATRGEKLRHDLGLGPAVRAGASSTVGVPLAFGFLHPVVLLPAPLVSKLPERDVEMLLAHELAHVKRYDFAVNLAQAVCESLLFFHPVTWWVSNKVREQREHCCDRRALELTARGDSAARIRYIAALLAAEESRWMPAPRLAASSSKGSLLARAEAILEGGGHPRADRCAYAVAACLAATLAALIVWPQPSLAAFRSAPGSDSVGSASLVPTAPIGNSPARVIRAEEAAVWRGAVAPGGWLRVRNLVGDILVERATGTEVEVTKVRRSGRESPVSFHASRQRDGVTICGIRPGVECDENGNVVRLPISDLIADSVTLRVRIPDGISLLVASSDGALQVLAQPVALQAQTGRGGIVVRGVRGPVEAATGGGRVAIDDVLGDVVVRSGGGDISLGLTRGDVQVRASKGDIDALLNRSPDARSWSFQTSSGSIRIRGQSLEAADIEVDAFNGRIVSDFPYVDVSTHSRSFSDKRVPGRNALFASTSAGNVTIRAVR